MIQFIQTELKGLKIYDNSKESIKAAKSVVVPIEIEYAQRIEKRLKYTIFLHS